MRNSRNNNCCTCLVLNNLTATCRCMKYMPGASYTDMSVSLSTCLSRRYKHVNVGGVIIGNKLLAVYYSNRSVQEEVPFVFEDRLANVIGHYTPNVVTFTLYMDQTNYCSCLVLSQGDAPFFTTKQSKMMDLRCIAFTKRNNE